MSRMVNWLKDHEYRMFFWANHKIQHAFLDLVLSKITHLGGATCTIAISLSIALFAVEPYKHTAWISLLALAVSHIPVAIMKKSYPRLRPYLVIPDTNICKNPLKDASFPSGHTTAIFSVILPFALIHGGIALALLPLAFIVGLSRIYLGLHYPSDCIAGGLIGTCAALLSVAFLG